jgi:membrane protein
MSIIHGAKRKRHAQYEGGTVVRTPWAIIHRDVTALVELTNRHDLGSYAAALAYNFVFALFPLLLFVSAGLGFIRIPLTRVMTEPLTALIPAAPWNLVLANLAAATRAERTGAATLGVAGFLWGMSGAFRQFMDAVNRVYEFPYPWRRSIVQFYGLSLILSMTVGIGVTAGVVAAVLAPATIWRWCRPLFGARPELLVVDAVRWGILIALFVLLLAVLYWIAPDRPPRFRWMTPGTLLVLTGWLTLSSAFTYYAGHFAHYNVVYGTLGGFLLLMVYLYLFGLLLLLGVQVNAYADGRPRVKRAMRRPRPNREPMRGGSRWGRPSRVR